MSFSFPTMTNPNITVATVPLVLTDASKTPRMMTSAEFGLRTITQSIDEYFGVLVSIAQS